MCFFVNRERRTFSIGGDNEYRDLEFNEKQLRVGKLLGELWNQSDKVRRQVQDFQ